MDNTNAPTRAQGRNGVIRLVLAFVLTALLVFVMLVVTGQLKIGPPINNGAGAFLNGDAASGEVFYYALDPNDTSRSNPNKEVPFAMGTPVTQRDEAGIKAELEERRESGTDKKFDPELTASHYADWSAAGLTKIEVAYSEIDAFQAKIAADPKLYAEVITELETLESASVFSVEEVPAGLWSVYVVPDGKGGLTTHVGRSSNPGQAAVFTHPSGTVIKYRLNCGFQILHETPPPGLPECEGYDCNPPVCPYNSNLPPDSPECFAPKDESEDGYVYPDEKEPVKDDGGGEKVADDVATTVEGENGGTTSSTDDPGDQTGTSSEGTTGNNGNNGQEQTNQGDTGNGTDTGGF